MHLRLISFEWVVASKSWKMKVTFIKVEYQTQKERS